MSTTATRQANTLRRATLLETQVRMYGCPEADLVKQIGGSITMKLSGPVMVAASLMSDAQEEMSMGMVEEARKTLNRAKWVLATYLMK